MPQAVELGRNAPWSGVTNQSVQRNILIGLKF
jgi:hypothetical protein